MEPADARRALAYLRIGLGAMWPVPGLGAKIFGLDPAEQPSVRLLGRLFAIRDLALGILLLQSEGEDADRQVDIGIVIDVADLLAIIAAGARRQIPGRLVVLGGSAAAAAATLGMLGRRRAV